MTDQEQQNKDIDRQIADNEARRATASQMRVSIWAIVAAIIIALMVALLYVTR